MSRLRLRAPDQLIDQSARFEACRTVKPGRNPSGRPALATGVQSGAGGCSWRGRENCHQSPACRPLIAPASSRWARLTAVPVTLAWVGDGAPRMEVAHAERRGRELTAVGTQLGTVYELRYVLEPDLLRLELVGHRSVEVPLDDADFFDLGWSPLFNSLPVIRDRLLESGPARDYVMRWVDVPSLEVTTSEQRYERLDNRMIYFRSGSFTARIQFDENEFVVDYPGIARRAGEE